MSTTARNKFRRATAALTAALLLLSTACSSQQEQAPELLATIDVAPASVAVTRGDVFSMDTVQATVVPETHELFFPISGNLGESYVQIGDVVKEGDVIMKLDDTSLVTRIENLEKELQTLRDSYAASNRKVEIKIEIAELQLQVLLEKQAAYEEAVRLAESSAVSVIDDVSDSESEPSEPESSSEPEESVSSEDNTTSGDSVSSEPTESDSIESEPESEPESSEPENEPTIPLPPPVDPYEIELKKLEIRGYELELSQAKELQRRMLEDKSEQLAELNEDKQDYYMLAPTDGVLIWQTKATDALERSGKRIVADTVVAILADVSSVTLQTKRLDNLFMSHCDRVYTIINGKEYDLTLLPNDPKEDSKRSMEGKLLHSNFSVETTDDISQAGSAIVCLRYNSVENVLTIPHGCTFYDTGYYVYRMNGTEREKVYVEIGAEGATCIEIISGLEEGDMIYVKS